MLAPGGALAVMDSPMFCREAEGHAMVADKLRRFKTDYGLTDVVHPNVGFLTFAALAETAASLGLHGRFFRSRGPLMWRARRRAGLVPPAARAGSLRRLVRAMILLYNPLSTTPGKQPLPLSIMSLAAVLDGPSGGSGHTREAWTIVDGNIERNPASAIIDLLSRVPDGDLALLAVTVMPGPQLTQAVAVCRVVRQALGHVPIVWGGYFPTQHTDTVLRSSFVDFVVRSQGEGPFIQLIAALRSGGGLDSVSSLSWKSAGRLVHNPAQAMMPLDELPDLPYGRINMEHYIHANYLGHRTVAHNSSFGCPFACNFCAVVAMSNRRWLAQTPARMERVARHLVSTYRVDALQMHDMDFFISEARTAEFAERIAPLGISWWGLGRIDTLMQVLGRDLAPDGAVGPADGVLGCRVGIGQGAGRDEQGREVVLASGSGARAADA